VQGDSNTHTFPLVISDKGKLVYTHLVRDGVIRPFSRLAYWFHIVLADGDLFDSDKYYLQYDDDRYNWQTIESSSLSLHWSAGDLPFGQAAFDAADSGLRSIQNLLPPGNGDPIRIYIYPSVAELQTTLDQGNVAWTAGHSLPDLGVALVSIAPGETQSIEMERQIPHELAHILLYRLAGPAYPNLPAWLSEGIATQAELYPNTDYVEALNLAVKNKTLLPLASLCGPFPDDASAAMLAYAESGSFTRYLVQTYGASSLTGIIHEYMDGLTCEQGTVQTTGLTLTQLEHAWQRTSLGEKTAGTALKNLIPYLLLLIFALLIPLGAWLFRPGRGQNGGNESH
jgi:Peptidase MA superfamily